MKKYLWIVPLALALFLPTVVHAGDCFQDPIYERNWNGVVTTGMRVRDVACMEGSQVLTTVPVGEVVKVIAETDGWYKVQTKDGTIGWSGQWLLEQTSQPFDPVQSTNPSAEPQEPLFDISGHTYETAIRYLADNQIIQGYPDGSYQPSRNLNRAEFTKIIVGAKLGSEPTSSSASCFPDVSASDWFVSYVCYAKNNGIISGYEDGYFRPAGEINLAEASKILVNTMELSTNSELPEEPWYRIFIESLQNKNYLPNTFSALGQKVNRAQMAELMWRIMEEKNDQPNAQFEFKDPLSSDDLACIDQNVPSTIDMDEVRQTWLSWYNQARAAGGLSAYTYAPTLNYTATVWSEDSLERGVMSHQRPGDTSDYDYSGITNWFKDLGVEFDGSSGVTYSENIGRGTYRCSDSDCTQELIDAIRPVFDAYMAEKGTSYTAHYDSVMSPHFNVIGLGIAVSPEKQTQYLTVHYAVGLSKEPSGICK